MSAHDESYKVLFSQPALVADLVRGFVREPWVAELDLSTLQLQAGSFISDKLRRREADVVWRARFRNGWLYLYLLLELQSTVDPFMAVRMMVYVGMLYQGLIRTLRLKAGSRLPPVLPIVLYNGERRWDAARDLDELVEDAPGGLGAFRPRLSYLLLDEGAFSAAELPAAYNLAAALFRLENSRNPAEAAVVVEQLVECLALSDHASLRQAFATWLTRVLVPGKLGGQAIEGVEDLEEVRTMLATRVKQWTEQWRREGLQEGLQQGLQQGLLEGRAALLLELLEAKFGPLSEETRKRVQAGSEKQMSDWGRRVLGSESLEQLLDGDEE